MQIFLKNNKQSVVSIWLQGEHMKQQTITHDSSKYKAVVQTPNNHVDTTRSWLGSLTRTTSRWLRSHWRWGDFKMVSTCPASNPSLDQDQCRNKLYRKLYRTQTQHTSKAVIMYILTRRKSANEPVHLNQRSYRIFSLQLAAACCIRYFIY